MSDQGSEISQVLEDAGTRFQPSKSVAWALNLTERRLHQLVVDGVIPKAGRDTYDLIECTRAYAAYLQKRTLGKDYNIDAHAERARLVKAQADIAELDLAQMQGELIHCDAVAEHWGRQVVAMKTKILGMANKLAYELVQATTIPEIESAIREEAVAALGELRDGIPDRNMETGERATGGAKVSAKTHSKSVGGSKPPSKPRSKRRTRAVAH